MRGHSGEGEKIRGKEQSIGLLRLKTKHEHKRFAGLGVACSALQKLKPLNHEPKLTEVIGSLLTFIDFGSGP